MINAGQRSSTAFVFGGDPLHRSPYICCRKEFHPKTSALTDSLHSALVAPLLRAGHKVAAFAACYSMTEKDNWQQFLLEARFPAASITVALAPPKAATKATTSRAETRYAQYTTLHAAYSLLAAAEASMRRPFDWVIKARSDLLFHGSLDPAWLDALPANTIAVPSTSHQDYIGSNMTWRRACHFLDTRCAYPDFTMHMWPSKGTPEQLVFGARRPMATWFGLGGALGGAAALPFEVHHWRHGHLPVELLLLRWLLHHNVSLAFVHLPFTFREAPEWSFPGPCLFCVHASTSVNVVTLADAAGVRTIHTARGGVLLAERTPRWHCQVPPSILRSFMLTCGKGATDANPSAACKATRTCCLRPGATVVT